MIFALPVFGNRTFTFCIIISIGLQVLSLRAARQQAENTPGSQGPKHPSEFEAFLDNIISEQMQELHVPGVVLALVKGDKVFFLKGYGLANIAENKPVDPQKTLFRVASVSKVLTVTAIMQLVERRLIDLNTDINQYIDKFEISGRFSQPITVEHLITHTAGFDDSRIGLASLSETSLMSLDDFLAHHLPARVMPPGREYSYSRYGIALAGHIVETVSGSSFSRYIEEQILQPLAMRRSGFTRRNDMLTDFATGYRFDGGRLDAVPYYHFFTAPEASFNATAADMARFMLAHLNGGEHDGARILHSATVKLMHQQHFSHHTGLPGLAYGFYERLENGQRAIQHGGHIPGFVSRMLLLPEQKLGLFISCNSDAFKLISVVTSEFFNRYFPAQNTAAQTEKADAQPELPPDGAGASTNLSRFAGTYRINEYARKTIEKIFSLKKQFRIKVDGDGLSVKGSKHLVAVDTLVFREVETGELTAFRTDTAGVVTRWFSKRFAYEKMRCYETVQFHLTAVLLMSIVFLVGFLFWAGGHIPKLNFLPFIQSVETNGVFRLAGVVSLLNLVFLAGLTLLFLTFDRIDEFTFGIPPLIVGWLCLPMAGATLTVGLLVAEIKVCISKTYSFSSRVYFTLVTLTSVGFLLFLNHWNLLGFHF